MEALRVRLGVERDAVFGYTRRAKVVGYRTDGDDQRVIGHRPRLDDDLALVVEHRRELDVLLLAIDAGKCAEPIVEMVPARLRQIFELVVVEVHAAGRDLVQQRLPEVGARAVDERDLGALLLAEGVAEARGELKAAGASADDDDAVHGRGCGGHGCGLGKDSWAECSKDAFPTPAGLDFIHEEQQPAARARRVAS